MAIIASIAGADSPISSHSMSVIFRTNKTETYNLLIDLLCHFNPKQIYFYPNKDNFSKLTSISFDKAFVESNDKNYMLNLDADWTDLGSWETE